MKIKLQKITLDIKDEDTGAVTCLTCGVETDFGWRATGDTLPLFLRYITLMAHIQEFMREEKRR